MIKILDNITLIPISTQDIDDIFETINNERIFLRKWLPFVDKTKERSDISAFVNNVLETKQKSFTIRQNNKVIGLIGIHNIDIDNRKAEIGYWLSEKEQGKGIISNSVQ